MKDHGTLSQVLSFFAVLGFVMMLVESGAAGASFHAPPPQLLEKEVRIAAVPEKYIFEQRKRFQHITDFLSRKLNTHVEFEIIPDQGKLCEAFIKRRINAAFFDSFSYVLARGKIAIEPLARPMWREGGSSYNSYIFVRKDSSIFSARDMKGKRLALVDKASAGGFLFPLCYFRKISIVDLKGYFSKVLFAHSYDAAAWAVYIGEVDIGVTKSQVFRQLGEEYPDFAEQMVVIAKSRDLPSTGLTVSTHMDATLKEHLGYILIHMDKTDEGLEVLRKFGASSFIRSKDEDYLPIYQMIKETGLDLNRYECGGDDVATARVPPF